MECSDKLWQKSQLNPLVNSSDLPTEKMWKDLLTLHPEVDHPSGLMHQECYNAWKFLHDLCHYGPEYFAQFCAKLSEPEVIEQIPLLKTLIIPAWAMEFSNSTVSGNISTIKNLAEQGGVGNPDDPEQQYNVVDLSKHVILFHGNLGTGNRIMSLQLHQSIEDMP